MKSHDLARLLLTMPNLPIALQSMGHTYGSASHTDSHGAMRIGLMHNYGGQHIILGHGSYQWDYPVPPVIPSEPA